MIHLNINEDIDLGTFFPLPKSDTLIAAIVMPTTPTIRMRGDTIEFNTAGMRLKLNATVEELLKRLPGVVIDPQGGITVNGEKIQKLLVDGQDLFGSDPTLVTRNFNADMIEKIQILDKKDRKAEFTGIDDGKRTKTLNVVLKEDHKQGYFGKIESGTDINNYYNTNALLGSFKDKRQLVTIGKIADDGTSDYSGSVGDQDGEINLGVGVSDPFGASAGTGIPHIEGGGVHFANTWRQGLEHFELNYQLGGMSTKPLSIDTVEQLLPDSVYLQTQQKNSTNTSSHQTLAFRYEKYLDSLSIIEISFSGSGVDGQNESASSGNNYINNRKVNSSLQTIHSSNNIQQMQGSILWQIQSRKRKNRGFSLGYVVNNPHSKNTGYLYSADDFPLSGSNQTMSDTTDQKKIINTSQIINTGSIGYTEPLWKETILALQYEISSDINESALSTFNKQNEKYNSFVDSLSSHYKYNLLTQKSTLNIQHSGKHWHYVIGSDLFKYNYLQSDLSIGTNERYRYVIFSPRSLIRYKINNTKTIYFNYTGTTQLPSISQLQSVQNNNDPLHIMLGNPSLQPFLTQSLSLRYFRQNRFPLNLYLSQTFVSNNITLKTYTDPLGKQISQYVNTSGTENTSLFFSISKTVQPKNIDIGLNTTLSYGKYPNFVNSLLNQNEGYNGNVGFSIGYNKPDKYSLLIRPSVGLTWSSSSVNTGEVIRYLSQTHTADFDVFIFWNLEFNTNCVYNWRQKTSSLEKNNSTTILNAYLARNFVQNKLSIKWKINNLLGQNYAINRTVSANQVSENYSRIIGRYWMLSVAYRFSNTGKNH